MWLFYLVTIRTDRRTRYALIGFSKNVRLCARRLGNTAAGRVRRIAKSQQSLVRGSKRSDEFSFDFSVEEVLERVGERWVVCVWFRGVCRKASIPVEKRTASTRLRVVVKSYTQVIRRSPGREEHAGVIRTDSESNKRFVLAIKNGASVLWNHSV